MPTMHTFSGYLGICCSVLLLLTPYPPASPAKKSLQETRHDCIFPAMGVEFRVTYYAPADAGIAINRKIKQRVAQIENSLSDYKTSSEVSRFCQSAPHSIPQSVSSLAAPIFWDVGRRFLLRAILQRCERLPTVMSNAPSVCSLMAWLVRLNSQKSQLTDWGIL